MTATHSTSGPSAPCTWWSDRWAWRGALGAAPFGALAAILYALIVLRTPPVEALMAYALGAALASGVGCLLLGSLGGSVETIRHRLRTRADAADDDAHEPAHAVRAHGAVEACPEEPVGADAPAAEQDDARPAHAVAA